MITLHDQFLAQLFKLPGVLQRQLLYVAVQGVVLALIFLHLHKGESVSLPTAQPNSSACMPYLTSTLLSS